MANITLSISQENLSAVLNTITILFFLIGIFLLGWIRKRVSENLNKTLIYLMISLSGAIIVKLLVILMDLNIIGQFVYESFIMIPAVFFLIGIVSFYKSVVKEVRLPVHRVHHRIHHRSVRRRR